MFVFELKNNKNGYQFISQLISQISILKKYWDLFARVKAHDNHNLEILVKRVSVSFWGKIFFNKTDCSREILGDFTFGIDLKNSFIVNLNVTLDQIAKYFALLLYIVNKFIIKGIETEFLMLKVG